ncbi:MAG: pyridoxal phosphate-dependent aminotransferase [Candidatus Hydrogenedentes bacterium]|nr:pyridoxal phosphate-dependent aminotransferase [Candidatus Hydrogenedentota bacterium]
MTGEKLPMVDIARGEPDFPTPAHIKAAGIAAINDDFTKYTPQAGIPELRRAIARKLESENGVSVSPDQVVVSCGGKHAVDNAIRALVRGGNEAIVISPYWFAYTKQVKLAGGKPILVKAHESLGFLPDPKDIVSAITPKTRLLILNSPNNPTGAVYSRALLQELADIAVSNRLIVISDEVYEHMVFDGAEHVSIASLNVEIASRTVTVNSVSKTHAMTGWRIGYAAYPGNLAVDVVAIQNVTTSAPGAISQRAALTALTADASHIRTMTTAYAERRRFVLERIGRLPGLSAVPPAGAFYCFVNIEPWIRRQAGGSIIRSADDFAAVALQAAGVRVLSGVEFGAPSHIRLSFAVGMAALEEGLNRLEKWLKENYSP